MAFGDKIIETRKNRGITQQELGKLIGVDKRVISKYEKNQTIPSVMMAAEIAKALNVSLDFLISSDKALFIDDKELIELLKNYNKLNDDVKNTVKNILKALNLYSQAEKTLGKNL
jgi:transcriptional regulator with XRE-family HTH domain